MLNNLYVTVYTREAIVFQGQARTVSGFNEKGKFDILPQHVNFISLIQKNLLIRDAEGRSYDIAVPNGLLRVTQNKVDVYLGVKK